MISVPVPIDVHIIGATGSDTFARATPLRVAQVIALAICESLGSRAPADKRARTLQATIDGLRAGHFVLEIDGRIFRAPDEIVVCAGTATLRFFAATSPKFRALPTT